MGQKHSASTSGTFEELFVALDSDKSGDVDAKEIQAWIKDEQALGNTALDSRYLLEISKLILKAKRRVPSDESSPLVLTKPQILDFFGALPESDAKALTHSLRQEVGELRAKFLRRVFDRVRKRGYIDKEQLLHWVLTWPHLDNQPTVADSLFKEIDTNADARIDFDEFTAFFGHWSFRNFRQASAAILDLSAEQKDGVETEESKQAKQVAEFKKMQARCNGNKSKLAFELRRVPLGEAVVKIIPLAPLANIVVEYLLDVLRCKKCGECLHYNDPGTSKCPEPYFHSAAWSWHAGYYPCCSARQEEAKGCKYSAQHKF